MKVKHIWRQSADSPLQSLPWKQRLYPWDLPPDAPRKVFLAELERVPLPSDCTFVKDSLTLLKVPSSAFVDPKHGLVSISALWSLTVKLHFFFFALVKHKLPSYSGLHCSFQPCLCSFNHNNSASYTSAVRFPSLITPLNPVLEVRRQNQ